MGLATLGKHSPWQAQAAKVVVAPNCGYVLSVQLISTEKLTLLIVNLFLLLLDNV